MKFTDGYWMMREGVQANYAAQAYEFETDGTSFSVLATTRVIRHRGDTLQGPNLNVRLSSPMADVVRVSISHFEGGVDCGPHFEVFETSNTPGIEITDETLTLVSGALRARLTRGESWGLQFEADGKPLTHSPWRGLGYIKMSPPGEGAASYLHEQLNLGVGECVYGLGERFTPFMKNGQTVDIWNRDGGTGSDQAYKNIPFYMTNRGYGVFVNHPGEVSFEVASEKVSRVQFSVLGESLEYFVIYGPSPKEVLAKYTALTGRPALPPAWSFGLWLTTSFTTNYDEETVTGFIQGFADRDIPLHVFHFDCFWMRGFRWCDFEWDPAVFPDPTGMLARLKGRGLRISAWINSYIAQASPLFKEGKDKGYLLKRKSGGVWQWDMWQPGMAIVDFTNPDACTWYAAKLRALVLQGVDSLKTDFGERIPTEDVAYHDGSDSVVMHNYYPYLYNKTVFEMLKEVRGEGEAIVFARSATVGCQQFPVHWGGDCYSSFESMAESLRGGLSLGMSGFGFWSHDIGGFEGLPPVALYKRWIAFGLMSSHSRLHGSTSYRVPWLYDEEACDVLRFFTKLKCRLMPYLYSQAIVARDQGTPLMRAMTLEFPDDRTCDTLDRQYMLGESLLVAPVFSESGEVEFYVPSGSWTSLIDGRVYEGGKWYREVHGFQSLPLLVRPGTVLALGAEDSRPDYDFAEGVEFRVFKLAEGGTSRASVPDLRGNEAQSISVTNIGGDLKAEVSNPERAWSLT